MLLGLVDGVLSAPPYVVLALAYGLVYGMLGMMDLSIPLRFTAAAYGGVLAQEVLRRYPPADPAVLGAAVVGALLVGTSCQTALLPFLAARPLALLVASLGLSYVIQAILQGAFGADPLTFLYYPVEGGVEFFGLTATPLQLMSVAYSIAACCAVAILLRRAEWGRRVIAVGGDHEVAATVFALSRRRIAFEVTAVTSLVLAPAAIFYGASHGVSPATGVDMGLLAFVAAIVAGRGAPVTAALVVLALVIVRSMSLFVSTWMTIVIVLVAVISVAILERERGDPRRRAAILLSLFGAAAVAAATEHMLPAPMQVPIPAGFQELVPYAAVLLTLLVRSPEAHISASIRQV